MASTQGWITPLVARAVRLFTWPSNQIIGYRQGSKNEVEEASRNAWCVDNFVASCVLLDLLCFLALTLGACEILRYVAFLFCAWRVADIVATAVRMTLFKFLFETNAAVASHARVVVLGFINYIELCICFAVFYAAIPRHIHLPSPDKWDWFSPLYFSAITQLTIGYGDMYPTGPARALAAVQAFVGVILIVLLVSRFISVMKPIRSVS
ncbi:MAG: potassium channel family protein [Terracidiphilus sp.]|jgi:hypothetical protein